MESTVVLVFRIYNPLEPILIFLFALFKLLSLLVFPTPFLFSHLSALVVAYLYIEPLLLTIDNSSFHLYVSNLYQQCSLGGWFSLYNWQDFFH